ncbi:MAG: divergent polysaccharide deacetylase family protein [Pseudomonadota bacterium]
MADANSEPQVEDARIDGMGDGSRFGGFLKGVLLGGLGSAVALLGLTLTQPLPSHLPGVGQVEVVTPGQPATEVAPAEVAETEPERSELEAATVEAEPAPDAQQTEIAAVEPTAVATPPEQETSDQGAASGSSLPEASPQPAPDAASTETAALESASGQTTNAPIEAPAEPQETEQAETEQAALAPTQPETDTEPQLESQPEQEVSDVEEPVETAALDPVPEISLPGPAVEVNARAFDAPANAPLLAVVLEDPGSAGLAPGAMALLTMPLTFAVRPDRDGAVELAGAARSAGHEVLAQLPLVAPDGNVETPTSFSRATSPEDLANATRRALAGLEVAIGATTPTGSTIVNDRRAMEAILAPLGENGFAYLDLKSGIGSTAQRISEAGGFAYAESNRYAEGSADENEIYQMLDGAAFQARRQGTAIVTVGATSDALKAIVRWGLERGGQEVWFAPLSAVIARRQDG